MQLAHLLTAAGQLPDLLRRVTHRPARGLQGLLPAALALLHGGVGFVHPLLGDDGILLNGPSLGLHRKQFFQQGEVGFHLFQPRAERPAPFGQNLVELPAFVFALLELRLEQAKLLFAGFELLLGRVLHHELDQHRSDDSADSQHGQGPAERQQPAGQDQRNAQHKHCAQSPHRPDGQQLPIQQLRAMRFQVGLVSGHLFQPRIELDPPPQQRDLLSRALHGRHQVAVFVLHQDRLHSLR